MPSLIAATLASEKPTDGYLVNDVISILGNKLTGFNFTLTVIKEMSFESQQVRLFLQEYLMNQLVTSRNVFVKTKVCMFMTLHVYIPYICTHMYACTHYIHTCIRIYTYTHTHIHYTHTHVHKHTHVLYISSGVKAVY